MGIFKCCCSSLSSRFTDKRKKDQALEVANLIRRVMKNLESKKQYHIQRPTAWQEQTSRGNQNHNLAMGVI